MQASLYDGICPKRVRAFRYQVPFVFRSDSMAVLKRSQRLASFWESSYVRVFVALVLAFTAYVALSFYFINSYTNLLYDSRKQELKRLVEIGLNTIEPLRQQQRQGALSPEQARAAGVALVRRMTYTYGLGSNYLFMSDYVGDMLVQPFEPEKEGTSQWDLRDANGKYIIRELVAAAESPAGRGYVEYSYPPPGRKDPQTKVSYVVGIPEWDAYIGTGMYMEDIVAEQSLYMRNSLLLTGALAFVILGILILSLHPLMSSHSTLLQLFEQVQRHPDNLPSVPVERWRVGSEGWRLLSGLQSMFRRIESSQREVKDNQKRFTQVFHASPIPISITALADGQYVEVNDAWLQLFGYTRSEVEGASSLSLNVWVDPVQRNEMIAQLEDKGSLRDYEHLARTKAGQVRDLLVSAEVVELNHRLYNLSLLVDITERKQAHQELERRVAERTHELATLNAIAEVVSQSLDLKEIMNAALTKAMESMRMQVGTAYSLEEGQAPDEDKKLILAARQGLSAEFSKRVGTRRVRGTAIQVAAEAQKPVVWLVAHYPDLHIKEALELEGVRQVINVPLFAKGKFVGAFNLGTRQERTIAPEELALLAAIGQQVAVAVENAHLYHQAEQSAALAERSRLARELHDSVTQSLYGVTMYAEAAQLSLTAGSPLPAAEYLRELRDTAQEALREMRLLIFELRPPALEQRGLAAALQDRLETVEARGGVETSLQVEGTEGLPLTLQHELYHMAREALNNILKHAHAHKVQVHCIAGDRELCLEVCDDGVGFDPADQTKGGLGLAGMKERVQKIGGHLEIAASPGQGARLTVRVPLAPGEEG